jgi:capsular polysaccharide biosynthesis protein
MSDQVTELRSTVATLRRRKRVLAATAVVGLALGATYVIVQPPQLTSTSLVLLPEPIEGQSTGPDVDTQVRIASSATILEAAGAVLEPALPAESVLEMVEVTASTTQIVNIDASSTLASQAEALSQAVAESFVAYVNYAAREGISAAVAELQTRQVDLQAQIEALQGEITAARERQEEASPDSEDSRTEARVLAGLQTEQADLSLQLDKVKDQIAASAPLTSANAEASVVQPATAAVGPSTLQRLLIWMPLGVLICTVLALVVLLATARRDPRVRLRDEIADAIGSPVLAGVRSRPQRSVAGWSTLLETYNATPVESWAFRQVLRGLVPANHRGEPRAGKFDHPSSLTVVSLSSDGRGIAIGPQLAAFASSLGLATHLVTALGQDWAAPLWAACAADRTVPLRPGLFVGDVPDAEPIDLTVTLVVVDRRQPDLSNAPMTAATILSVASATATEQELARVVVAADDAGRRIDGVVVADPDQMDRTSGRHTMDERALQVALPVRLTGSGSSEVTVGDYNRRSP